MRPSGASMEQRREFARLVRRGFKTAGTGLAGRIRASRRLAFHYSSGEDLVAIAALKSPGDQYRRRVFDAAGLHEDYAGYKSELGWVYVEPAYRGNRLATTLCRRLLSDAAIDAVFATTRTDNAMMSRVLRTCGFDAAGKPYVYRGELLQVFLRP